MVWGSCTTIPRLVVTCVQDGGVIISCLQTTAGKQAYMLYGLLRLCLVAY